ncbi:hypothetical protein [Lysobacter sp. D1-1-M9]|uniref:hypothetical protein n=1 Tax=Novilysobacter longmucuonensis TaxID=3098603 RepID=UPI002FC7532B
MIKTTRARIQFKGMLGQANHFLITTLIGLNAVENNTAKPGSSLSASWNPRSVVASARRSRAFVLDMALVRAVDALDAYLSTAYRKPSLFEAASLRSEMDKAGHSVAKKFRAVCRHDLGPEPLLAALCRLAIDWRNRRVHSLADNELTADDRMLIEKSGTYIAAEYRGLSVATMLDNFGGSKEPTLKEAAGLINVMHHVVREIDAKLVAQVDMDRLVRESILVEMCVTTGTQAQWKKAKERCSKLWDAGEKNKKVPRYLESLGFSSVAPGESHHGMFEIFAQRTAGETMQFLQENTV